MRRLEAINLYTQENFSTTDPDADPGVNVYWPMNTALRSPEQIERIRPWWDYIALLQLALLKLPPAEPRCSKTGGLGDLYRGISKLPSAWFEELQRKQDQAQPEVWWPFTSTSMFEEVSREFLEGPAANQVLFTVDGEDSAARNVKEYSDFADEEELLMPCGSAFVIQAVEKEAGGLTVVSLHQTEAVLLLKHQKEVRMHRHEALTQLAEALDGAGTAVDSAGLRFEFGQPLPKGLLPFAISRCGQLCGEETSIWRSDLETIATTIGVQVEVTIGQQGPSAIALAARCHAGGHDALWDDCVACL